MVIVAGHLLVEADTRDCYLADCIAVVEQGRRERPLVTPREITHSLLVRCAGSDAR